MVKINQNTIPQSVVSSGHIVITLGQAPLAVILTCLLSIIAVCFIKSISRFHFGKKLCQRPLQGKENRAGQTAETVCPFLKSTRIELPAVTWTGGVIGSAAPAANADIRALAATGRNNILGLKLDDFHLSLCVLFHVYTPPFAENFYVKQLLRRITRKKIL